MLIFSTILDIADSMGKDEFIRAVIEWNDTGSHPENVIPGIAWNGERTVRYGTDKLWLQIEEFGDIIAVRHEKKQQNGTVWDTDYVANFDEGKLSVRLDRSYTEDAEPDPDSKFSTPHFISILIAHGYLKDDGDLNVHREPFYLSDEELEPLSDVINGYRTYRLPVVFVSRTHDGEEPVDVRIMAARLKGVAHVLVQTGVYQNREIRELCNDRNEFNGAIGIYYPLSSNKERQRFMYRGDMSFDNAQMEKVIRTVILYSNAQMTDPLYTWQGVRNAQLRDSLDKHTESLHRAQKAIKDAEAEIERTRIETRKETLGEAEGLIEGFDGEVQELKRKVEELSRSNDSLQLENQILKSRLDVRDNMPVLYFGDEPEFYPGEIKDLLLSLLSDSLKNVPERSRRADIAKDIVENNGYAKESASRAETIKKLLKDYRSMTPRLRKSLEDLGFRITEEGKHYKLTYYGDQRYMTTYPKTPSDNRSGMNCAQQTINIAF